MLDITSFIPPLRGELVSIARWLEPLEWHKGTSCMSFTSAGPKLTACTHIQVQVDSQLYAHKA